MSGKPRAVVVDTIADNLDLVGRFLANEEVGVVLIADACEAVEQAQRFDADVVLLSADAAIAACTDGRPIADGSGVCTAIYSPGTDMDEIVQWVRRQAEERRRAS